MKALALLFLLALPAMGQEAYQKHDTSYKSIWMAADAMNMKFNVTSHLRFANTMDIDTRTGTVTWIASPDSAATVFARWVFLNYNGYVDSLRRECDFYHSEANRWKAESDFWHGQFVKVVNLVKKHTDKMRELTK